MTCSTPTQNKQVDTALTFFGINLDHAYSILDTLLIRNVSQNITINKPCTVNVTVNITVNITQNVSCNNQTNNQTGNNTENLTCLVNVTQNLTENITIKSTCNSTLLVEGGIIDNLIFLRNPWAVDDFNGSYS